jgi:hypothetical protein
MVEWPQEHYRRLSNTTHVQQRFENIPAALFQEIEGTTTFASMVRHVVDAFNKKTDPKSVVAELTTSIDEPEGFGDYDEFVRQVVLANASVAAFREIPTRAMWEYLWSLAWHSASLANILPEAIVAATAESEFRKQFLVVAREVVMEASKNSGRRAAEYEKDIGPNLRDDWKKHPQLSNLWRGNFDRSFRAVGRDDDGILSIIAEIDVSEFVQLLACYDYPDPVAHALTWCGAQWQFERWRAVAAVAPAAFEKDATWNGSLILPLLISIAREQFQFDLGREPSSNKVSEVTNEIRSLATEIAKIIAPRSDALGCMTRWGNWLVRNAVPAVSANPIPYPTDATSQGFIDDALLDALIAEMPADRWRPVLELHIETWEVWCQFAFGALTALAGKASMPSPVEFLKEWDISPDDWPARRGLELKLHAKPFESGGLRADGYGARLLALSLIEAGDPGDQWKRFWGSTCALREIVEFGDSDRTNGDDWQSRADAARLLMLQFSIGLMMMDHLIEPPRSLVYNRSSAMEILLPQLADAVREMTAIDQLNGKFWSEAIRHLAIRRANWLSGSSKSGSIVLGIEAKPTLSDFIRTLAGDTENILALVYVAQQNGVDKAVLSAAFKTAMIDLRAEIAIAENLIAISSRKIALSEAQLDAARALL